MKDKSNKKEENNESKQIKEQIPFCGNDSEPLEP
jgi:hypothetical protein